MYQLVRQILEIMFAITQHDMLPASNVGSADTFWEPPSLQSTQSWMQRICIVYVRAAIYADYDDDDTDADDTATIALCTLQRWSSSTRWLGACGDVSVGSLRVLAAAAAASVGRVDFAETAMGPSTCSCGFPNAITVWIGESADEILGGVGRATGWVSCTWGHVRRRERRGW